MANFCTNCGTRLRKEDNFCPNCGTKIDKSDMNQNNNLRSSSDRIEKEKAKKELKRLVGGRLIYNKNFNQELSRNGLGFNNGKSIRQQVEKEIDSGQIKMGGVEFRVNQLIHEHKIKKEEENRILKEMDEIIESEEFKSEIEIEQKRRISLKNNLKNKIVNDRENMSEEEIRGLIKAEVKKAIQELKKAKIAKEKEKARIAKEKEVRMTKERTNGGYCGLSCRHCYEEFFDSGGGIVGDFDSEGYTEFYCHLGHPLVRGRFCEDYE